MRDGASARDVVAEYIAANFLLGVGSELDDATELMEAGILDSTGVMELVTFLETSFDVAITDEEITAENLNTVDNICKFVSRKLAPVI